MQSTTDIEALVKQANILGRLYRGATGALKEAPKGALIGGLLGGAVGIPTMGLGLGLGTAGAGAFSGAMFGAGARGAIGGVRGLLSGGAKAMAPSAGGQFSRGVSNAVQASNMLFSPVVPLVGGGLAGYALSGEDNKLLGTAMGAGGGLLARPAIMNMLARRAGRV